MASAGYSIPAMEAEIKTFINAKLKDVLRDEGLLVSGIKSELQMRLIACK